MVLYMSTITLKNVSTSLHSKLKQRARMNNRSLNREAIACLEAQILPELRDPDEILREIAAFRTEMKHIGVPPLDEAFLTSAIDKGRE